MIIYKEILKYLSLEISAFEFEEILTHNHGIMCQLESLIPDKNDLDSDSWNSLDAKDVLIETSFDIMATINMFGGFKKAMGRATAYTLIYQLVCPYVSDLSFNDYYDKQFSFFLDTVPSYIGGKEAELYIEKIYNSIPGEMKEKDKKKFFKTKLKDLFTYISKKPPVWIQEPEWPIMDTPLQFIKQENEGSLYKYYFCDPNSGCFKVIEQYA